VTTQAKYFIFGVLFALLVGVVIYGLSHISTIPVPEASSLVIQPTLTVPSPITKSPEKTTTPKISIEDAGGAIAESEKTQIIQKVINPFLDYYRDAGQGKIISLIISLNTKPNNVTYPFLAEGVIDSGAKMSFVIERKGIDLSWWVPECMGPCLLTDEFRGKYPEIMKKLE
jgi:hypothetical protein